MMYCDLFGDKTNDNRMSNSFNLEKNNIQEVAKHIATALTIHSLFFNIQVPSEGSQYDILMSIDHLNQGLHQRGIKHNDLLIGIVGSGCYGFSCRGINNTSVGYYYEKLKVESELLTQLFNSIRDELGVEII